MPGGRTRFLDLQPVKLLPSPLFAGHFSKPGTNAADAAAPSADRPSRHVALRPRPVAEK